MWVGQGEVQVWVGQGEVQVWVGQGEVQVWVGQGEVQVWVGLPPHLEPSSSAVGAELVRRVPTCLQDNKQQTNKVACMPH